MAGWLLAWAYAAPPLRLGQRGGAEVSAALVWWLVVLAYGWLAGGVALLYQPHQALWGLLSLPVSLAAAGMFWGAASQPKRVLLAGQFTAAAALLHGLAMAAGLVTVTMF